MSNVAQFKKDTDAAADAEEATGQTADAPVPFDDDGPKVHEDQSGDNKDYAAAAELIGKVEAEQAKIDEHAEEYKAKAAPHRDEMAALKKQIRDDHGIEAKALSTILAQRRQERRMKARIEALEEPAASQLEQLEMAL